MTTLTLIYKEKSAFLISDMEVKENALNLLDQIANSTEEDISIEFSQIVFLYAILALNRKEKIIPASNIILKVGDLTEVVTNNRISRKMLDLMYCPVSEFIEMILDKSYE